MDWYYLYVSVPIVTCGIWSARGLMAPRGYVTSVIAEKPGQSRTKPTGFEWVWKMMVRVVARVTDEAYVQQALHRMGRSEDTRLTAEALISVLVGAVCVTVAFYMETWNSHNTEQEMVSENRWSFPRRVQPDRIPRNAVVPQLHEAEGRYDNM